MPKSYPRVAFILDSDTNDHPRQKLTHLVTIILVFPSVAVSLRTNGSADTARGPSVRGGTCSGCMRAGVPMLPPHVGLLQVKMAARSLQQVWVERKEHLKRALSYAAAISDLGSSVGGR